MTSKSTIEERFWARVDRRDHGECWLWKGAPNNSGYGAIGVAGGRVVPVHRWSYEQFVGPIPDGLHVDHLCRTRMCVNPKHLEAVTQRENTLRGNGFAADEARRTHCPQGHPYDEQNTYRYRGLRYCLICRRAHARASNARTAARRAAQRARSRDATA